MNRRNFVKNSSIALSAIMIKPWNSLASNNSPNSLINVGIIGAGPHGIERNLRHYLKYPELCRVVAVCDVSLERAAKAQSLVNETYNSKDCMSYQDFRELLDDPSIDAVQITTPDHWHVPMSIMAALKGKHVCCEKPTLTIDEGRLLCNVIKKTGVVYQVSLEDRFLPVYRHMAEIALNGRLGAIRHIEISLPNARMPTTGLEIEKPPQDFDYDLWLGPAKEVPFIPSRTFFHFRWYDAFSGGILTDWGAHYCDTAQLVTKTDYSGPTEVYPEGETRFHEGIFNTAFQYDLRYKYANGITMRVKNGNPYIKIEGNEAWVDSDGWLAPLKASNENILEIPRKKVALPVADDEFINFLESIKQGKKPVYHCEVGHRTSSLLHCGNIALTLNRKVQWDPKKERFVNDPEAEKFRKKEMRDKWSYNKICPGFNY